jgi:hypothetical protein
MPAPRKIFRIEETVAARRTGAHQADARQASAHQADTHNIRDGMTAPDPHAEIMQALQTLRATFHATTPRLVASAADNASPLNAAQLARIGHELEAVVPRKKFSLRPRKSISLPAILPRRSKASSNGMQHRIFPIW